MPFDEGFAAPRVNTCDCCGWIGHSSRSRQRLSPSRRSRSPPASPIRVTSPAFARGRSGCHRAHFDRHRLKCSARSARSPGSLDSTPAQIDRAREELPKRPNSSRHIPEQVGRSTLVAVGPTAHRLAAAPKWPIHKPARFPTAECSDARSSKSAVARWPAASYMRARDALHRRFLHRAVRRSRSPQ